MDVTLVILAAGMGARYGAGIKQLEKVGPDGEIIMDFSIHDAVRAGFNKVVFVIRRAIFDEFREVIGDRTEARLAPLGVKCAYAFQELDDAPAGRTKPWGTAQAVMACAGLLDGPFAVINADDYYGKDAFAAAYDFLAGYDPADQSRCAMIGFQLKNTLSDAGGVTRGLCAMDERGYLTKVTETSHVIRTAGGPVQQDTMRPLDPDGLVSMNMWVLTPGSVGMMAEGFPAFKAGMKDPRKDEYLLPDVVDGLLRAKRLTVKVLPTDDQWYGITFHEDRETVAAAFRDMVDRGVYERDLFSDVR